jgi:hypothetical protein
MAGDVPKGYNTPIPVKVTTPDQVETSLGTLDFDDGVPTEETAQKLFHNLDLMRAVEVFLNCIPAASMEAVRLGLAEVGADANHKMGIFDHLLDSNPLFLTGNTDTVYCSGFLDLADGPVVVEVPPGCGPGTVNDAWFRFVVDMGGPGPDRGQGGKYLLLPPDYEGEEPEGYFVARSRSYGNALVLRGFLVDGKPDAAARMFREGVRIYPLSEANDPPQMEFVSTSERQFNTVHANNVDYFDEIAPVIAREPVEMIDPETRGLLASIGIHKDKPFAPDERMREILVEAAAIGNATARALFFHNRDEGFLLYDDRQWHTFFIGGDYRWLRDDGRGGRHLDARSVYFYVATVNTPAMALEMVGIGSQYGGASKDADGDCLDGAADYRLRLPAGVPVKDFWSVCVYDPQTRSELQTGQPFPSLNNVSGDLEFNSDGSVDLLFGPEPPAEKAGNWIQTVPGKGWFAVIRLYGPLEGWFDKTWRPNDIEKI